MKNIILITSLIFSGFSTAVYAETIIEWNETGQKEGLSVTISATYGSEPVEGALVKITHERTVVGAGNTDANGSANISLPQYGKQLVTIEVYHSLYRASKLKDIVLENGKTYSFSMKSKSETVEEITAESAKTESKLESKIKD